MFLIRSVWIIALALLIAGCATTDHSEIETGTTQSFVPGYPNFNFSAWTEFEDDDQFIEVMAIIPYRNLVFRSEQGERFKNEFQITLIIRDLNNNGEPVQNMTLQREIITETYRESRGNNNHFFHRKLSIEPGEYSVEVIVNDQMSKKRTSQRTRLSVPDFTSGSVHIGSLLLQRKYDNRDFLPVSSYYLNESQDSLKTTLQIHVTEPSEHTRLELRLLKFRADTSAARPPHFHTPMIGSIQYRGINYDRPDTLQTNIRTLENLSGTIDIDFLLPDLRRGNYRAEIKAFTNDELTFRRARDFSVMPPDFPSIRNIRELSEALAYITYPREHQRIMDADSPAELRNNFDEFWATSIGNRNRALATIERYYTRVEEANQMFTTHKEGWKTDFGMIYILFGPPMYKEQYIDGESWYYQLGSGSQSIRFYFERSRAGGFNNPMSNYVLRRDRYYEQFYFRVYEDWRRGAVR